MIASLKSDIVVSWKNLNMIIDNNSKMEDPGLKLEKVCRIKQKNFLFKYY